jgi:hypothetical protein
MGLHNARAGLAGSQGGRRGCNAEGCKQVSWLAAEKSRPARGALRACE